MINFIYSSKLMTQVLSFVQLILHWKSQNQFLLVLKTRKGQKNQYHSFEQSSWGLESWDFPKVILLVLARVLLTLSPVCSQTQYEGVSKDTEIFFPWNLLRRMKTYCSKLNILEMWNIVLNSFCILRKMECSVEYSGPWFWWCGLDSIQIKLIVFLYFEMCSLRWWMTNWGFFGDNLQ